MANMARAGYVDLAAGSTRTQQAQTEGGGRTQGVRDIARPQQLGGWQRGRGAYARNRPVLKHGRQQVCHQR